MLVAILSILTFVSAILTILAAYQKRQLILYLFKPLTILFVILIALQPRYSTSSFYRYAIIAGLLLSLVGDIFLMLPSDRFVPGLVSFLFAHICYTFAFIYESEHDLSYWHFMPFIFYGSLMMSVLLPHLGKMSFPVVVYMFAILIMGWTATSRHLLTQQGGSLLALIGAILFIASDSVLALDRFKGHFRSAQFLILSTYFTAQWLIALST